MAARTGRTGAGKAKGKEAGRKTLSEKAKAQPKPKRTEYAAKQLRVARFVEQYVIDFNGRRAAVAAGYALASARKTASELLADPEVWAKVEALRAKQASEADIEKAEILGRLAAIARADPRDLIELHRGCCRYCWGTNHLYQRTPREMDEARATHLLEQADKAVPAPFSEAGGLGWNPTRDPHPECPECFGEGEARVVPKDTRDIPPAARVLYAGVKQTQHGLEIKMHDQAAALAKLGEHLGLWRQRHEHSGPGGGPVVHEIGQILDEIGGSGGDTGVGPSSG